MNIDETSIYKKVKSWINFANDDLKLAEHALTLSTSVPYYLIAYHAQQCAEKYLKAFLVFVMEDFPYTHNIGLLLDLAANHAELPKQLSDALVLTDYAVIARYPGDFNVNKDEAIHAIAIACQVKEAVLIALNQKGYKIDP